MTFERLLSCLEQILLGAYHSQVAQPVIGTNADTFRSLHNQESLKGPFRLKQVLLSTWVIGIQALLP